MTIQEIQVNWTRQFDPSPRDTTDYYRVFVGDISPEVNDEVLRKAFSAFDSLSNAQIMWDMNSGKSRGYGFLTFREKTDADQAIATMNGEWLGSSAIRVCWANGNTQNSSFGLPGSHDSVDWLSPPVAPPFESTVQQGPPDQTTDYVGYYQNYWGGYHGSRSHDSVDRSSPSALPYESVVEQAPRDQKTVHVGNLVPYCTQADLIPLFQSIGYLSEIRMQADHGYASVSLDTHEHAAMAIVQLQGQMVHGRPIKCGVCIENLGQFYLIFKVNMLTFCSGIRVAAPWPSKALAIRYVLFCAT